VKISKRKIKNSIRSELPKIAMLPKIQFGPLGVTKKVESFKSSFEFILGIFTIKKKIYNFLRR